MDRLAEMLRERFPEHRHVYIGVSGATLLHDALKSEDRSSIVLPAFLCPSLSAMALAAGKRVTHIDSCVESMHPDASRLEAFLEKESTQDTAVLIDHSFGYRCDVLVDLRRRFPQLLIIEDCARALGLEVGRHADWILLSMYKTIRGSSNGGILLSRSPLPLPPGIRVATTVRERAARIPALRSSYDFLQRFRRFPELDSLPSIPAWRPQRGLPGELCVACFIAELEHEERAMRERSAAASEIREAVAEIKGVRCLNELESAAHFVTFRFCSGRDRLLRQLRLRGTFLSRTWERLPRDYQAFSGTFPFGSETSALWSREIVHVPMSLFLAPRPRKRLIGTLRTSISN